MRSMPRWPALLAGLLLPSTVLADGVPTPHKVVIVIEENKGYSQIIGSPDAPFINALAQGGALLTNSFGITHPSQPNYIALFCGSTLGITTNGYYAHSLFVAEPNLGAKLLAQGLTFGGYSETLPSVGWDGESWGATATGFYKRKHNPWVNWQAPTTPPDVNEVPAAVNMPFDGYFPSDFEALPALSVVVPNQLHDMHDGTIAQADDWLVAHLAAYAAWSRDHDSLLIVTFDEDNSLEGNHVVTLFYGPMVIPGEYAGFANHYTVLRTLEDMFALPHHAGTLAQQPITNIWLPACPANCDGSTIAPALNVSDFVCFLNRFAADDPRANCDLSSVAPVLNVNDFTCFLNRFVAGCP